MTNETVIATADFGDAEELAQAIKTLLNELGNEVVYISCDKGFMHTGRVSLIEKTLSDGSKTYDMEIGEED